MNIFDTPLETRASASHSRIIYEIRQCRSRLSIVQDHIMDSDPFSIQNFRETRTHIIGMQSKIYPSLWQASNIKLYFQTRYRVCLEQIERLNELPQSTSEAREQVESMGEDDARTLGKHKNLEDKLDSAAFLDSRLKEFARCVALAFSE